MISKFKKSIKAFFLFLFWFCPVLAFFSSLIACCYIGFSLSLEHHGYGSHPKGALSEINSARYNVLTGEIDDMGLRIYTISNELDRMEELIQSVDEKKYVVEFEALKNFVNYYIQRHVHERHMEDKAVILSDPENP